MFEKRHQKVATVHAFAKRMCAYLGFAFALIAVALAIGIAGYHWIARLSLIDSFLNASMILGGMGPVNELAGSSAKFFAACYALFSGLVFVGVMGIILTPIVHRVMHTFHVDEK